jgi:MoxR-like ATPase
MSMTTPAEHPPTADSADTFAPDGPASWWLFTGSGRPDPQRPVEFPAPPPWRRFPGVPAGPIGWPDRDGADSRRLGDHRVGVSYHSRRAELDLINAAIYLRRPMLVTGKAGTGKSTLATSIAAELNLGPVLRWPITSRSSLGDGLYRYDAIGRLQEVSLLQRQARVRVRRGPPIPGPSRGPDIGDFIRLGPLGSALLPRHRPRVLLVDEIDKSDIDLPNDLLTVFEEGSFEIPELHRMRSTQPVVPVMDADSDVPVPVHHGFVQCAEFPIVVLTSNGERDFPPAFLRRCVRIRLGAPDHDRLAEIVEAHLGPVALQDGEDVINDFLARQQASTDLAADQLLNALYLTTAGTRDPGESIAEVLDALLRPLNISDR